MIRPAPLLVVLAVAALPRPARADPVPAAARRVLTRIRTTDSAVQTLVDAGVRASPTFRSLVARIERSDVVVYVQADLRCPNGLDGRLTFVSKAGGRRYVLVRIRYLGATAHDLAILGHELQHAAEIADTPAIVDSRSLSRAYARFGRESGWSGSAGAFDTDRAVHTGSRIFEEIRMDAGRRVRADAVSGTR